MIILICIYFGLIYSQMACVDIWIILFAKIQKNKVALELTKKHIQSVTIHIYMAHFYNFFSIMWEAHASSSLRRFGNSTMLNLIFDDFQESLRHLEWFFEKMAESRPPLFFNFRGGLLSSIFAKNHSKSLKTGIQKSRNAKFDLRHSEWFLEKMVESRPP